VRAIILKARRLGISTYVGARFYQPLTLWLGRNAFILTHEDKSTQELFDLVKRIHEHMPLDYRPQTKRPTPTSSLRRSRRRLPRRHRQEHAPAPAAA
jgi:hypothetical protein